MTWQITKKLTAKENLFVGEYLISLNASDAYRKAGYNGKNANVRGGRGILDQLLSFSD